MHPNEKLIRTFYIAFAERDHETMTSFYHVDAHFRDPVFNLEGSREISAMWNMLCERGHDLEISFDHISADDSNGSARWEADYTFSQTGRKVHNIIRASFKFQNGLIIEHTDSFSFWAWSKQSLGFIGLFLGWSGWLKNVIKRKANHSLDQFIAENT